MSELPLKNPEVLAADGPDEVIRVGLDASPPVEVPIRRRDDLELFGPQALVASP